MKVISVYDLVKIRFHADDILILSAKRKSGCTASFSQGRLLSAFVYIYDGSIKIQNNDKVYEIVKGDLVYIPQNYKYRTVYTADMTNAIIINFSINDGEENYIFSQDIERYNYGAKSTTIWDRMLECSAMTVDIKSIFSQELFFSLLYKIISDENNICRDIRFEKIMPAVRELESRFDIKMNIPGIASKVNVSESYFRQLFHEFTGMSPIEYRNNIKIKHARELLQTGSYNVKEAAETTGFNNVSYFCRLYYKLTGKHAGSEF